MKKAWLYSLYSLNQDIPDHKSLPLSLNRIAQTDLAGGTFRKKWKSPSYLQGTSQYLGNFSSDIKKLVYRPEKTGANYSYLLEVEKGISEQVVGPIKSAPLGRGLYGSRYTRDIGLIASKIFSSITNTVNIIVRDLDKKQDLETLETYYGYQEGFRSSFLEVHPFLPVLVYSIKYSDAEVLYMKKVNGPQERIMGFDLLTCMICKTSFEQTYQQYKEDGIELDQWRLEIEKVEFSADGKRLMVYDRKQHVYLYDIWDPINNEVNLGRVASPSYSFHIAATEVLDTVHTKGERKKTSLNIDAPSISSTGAYLAVPPTHTSNAKEHILLYSLATQRQQNEPAKLPAGDKIVFSHDDQFIAYRHYYADRDTHCIRIYELQKQKLLAELDGAAWEGYIEVLGFDQESQVLAVSSSQGEIIYWGLAKGKDSWQFPGNYSFQGMGIASDGKTLYTASNEGLIVKDISKKSPDRSLQPPKGAKKEDTYLAYSPSGVLAGLFPASGNEGKARILQMWKTDANGETSLGAHRVIGEYAYQMYMTIHADGSLVALKEDDNHIFVCHTGSRLKMKLPIPTDAGKLNNLNFGHTAHRLVAVFESRKILVWEIPDPEQATWKPAKPIYKITVSDGEELLCATLIKEKLFFLTHTYLRRKDLKKEKLQEVPLKTVLRNCKGMLAFPGRNILMVSVAHEQHPEIHFYDMNTLSLIHQIPIDGTPSHAVRWCIDSSATVLVIADIERDFLSLFNLEFLLNYLTDGKEGELFKQIYEKSFRHLSYEMKGIDLVEVPKENKAELLADRIPVGMHPWEYLKEGY